jgi:hypothetical protein
MLKFIQLFFSLFLSFIISAPFSFSASEPPIITYGTSKFKVDFQQGLSSNNSDVAFIVKLQNPDVQSKRRDATIYLPRDKKDKTYTIDP